MREEKKLIRRMKLIVIWTLFIALTSAGFVAAYEQTRFVDEGKEPQTVKWSIAQQEKLYQHQN